MSLFGKRKREKAIAALKAQCGIDLYGSDLHADEKLMEYRVHLSDGGDFVAVINRKKAGRFVEKEWYVYHKSSGWAKQASMNRRQSIRLYADTKPYDMADLLETSGGQLTAEAEESICCAICDEYLSSYMTKRYFGFSIRVYSDTLWEQGTIGTQAIYMPHRDPDPREETPEERVMREKKLQAAIDRLTDLLEKIP